MSYPITFPFALAITSTQQPLYKLAHLDGDLNEPPVKCILGFANPRHSSEYIYHLYKGKVPKGTSFKVYENRVNLLEGFKSMEPLLADKDIHYLLLDPPIDPKQESRLVAIADFIAALERQYQGPNFADLN